MPMVAPIANGCVPLATMAIVSGDHWRHYNGSNGIPLDGDTFSRSPLRVNVSFGIPMESNGFQWNPMAPNGDNGDNEYNGDNGDNEYNGDNGTNGDSGAKDDNQKIILPIYRH